MANDLSLDEIANRIIDAVLNERFINKESLQKIIRPILKSWLKITDSYISQKVSDNRLQKTIEQRGIERTFWLNKVRDLKGIDNMQADYDELHNILVKEGYKKIK